VLVLVQTTPVLSVPLVSVVLLRLRRLRWLVLVLVQTTPVLSVLVLVLVPVQQQRQDQYQGHELMALHLMVDARAC